MQEQGRTKPPGVLESTHCSMGYAYLCVHVFKKFKILKIKGTSFVKEEKKKRKAKIIKYGCPVVQLSLVMQQSGCVELISGSW